MKQVGRTVYVTPNTFQSYDALWRFVARVGKRFTVRMVSSLSEV